MSSVSIPFYPFPSPFLLGDLVNTNPGQISCEVSKLQDWVLYWPYRFEIWHASLQQCCQGACQISGRLTRILRFQDLTRSCEDVRPWIEAHGPLTSSLHEGHGSLVLDDLDGTVHGSLVLDSLTRGHHHAPTDRINGIRDQTRSDCYHWNGEWSMSGNGLVIQS